jgi:hypothetical protein
MTTFAYIFVAFLVGLMLGRFRARAIQNQGEALVSRTVSHNFSAPDYHLMNHITLPLGQGTTQIDHVLVSRFGVFVIETKDYKGWIFANANHANWTQVLFKQKFKFQNPIFQNQMHVRAVRELLDFLPPEAVKSVVIFAGEAEFKTRLPEGVFTLKGAINQIKQSESEVLSQNRMQFCVGRLETARLSVTRATDIQHVRALERRHGRSS